MIAAIAVNVVCCIEGKQSHLLLYLGEKQQHFSCLVSVVFKKVYVAYTISNDSSTHDSVLLYLRTALVFLEAVSQ